MPWPAFAFVADQMMKKGTKGTGKTIGFDDMIRKHLERTGQLNPMRTDGSGGGGSMPSNLSFPIGYPTGPGRDQAFETLMEILGNQGKTDPMAMNQLLTGIQRGTQTTQSGLMQSLAQAGPGMQQSGVGQALHTAIGQAGEGRKAGAIATENQLAEDRKRQDLMMWLQMVVDPALTSYGIREGVAAQRYQGDMMKQGAQWNAYSKLASAAFDNAPNIFNMFKKNSVPVTPAAPNYGTSPNTPPPTSAYGSYQYGVG